MSIGHKGMMHAAKAMAMTMLDLYENPKMIEEVRQEYKDRKGAEVYKAMIPEGPPPIPSR